MNGVIVYNKTLNSSYLKNIFFDFLKIVLVVFFIKCRVMTWSKKRSLN